MISNITPVTEIQTSAVKGFKDTAHIGVCHSNTIYG